MKSLIICALGSLFFGCHHQPKKASVPPATTNTQAADTMWKKEFEQLLPKLGHRNWILVVDKAFPLQSAPGIVTINTGEPMRPVLGELVRMLEKASHIKPVYYTDLELNSLSDDLCPGAEQARTEIFQALQDAQVNTILHEEVFSKIDTASKLFTTVVLKTESTIPYSSVFIELDCGYWSAAAEKALRTKMKSRPKR